MSDLIDRLKNGVASTGDLHSDNETELFHVDDASETMAEAANRIAALEAQLAERVKVKPLEWTELSTGWIAHTSFHTYEVVKTDHGFMATYANRDFAWGTEDAMKSAAQADFERRILSALDTHPRYTSPVDAHETVNVSDKPEGQQEPVAWLTNLGWIDSPRYTVSFEGDKTGCENFPVYTRPSEQAVTEAMQVRIVEAVHHIVFIKAMNGTTDEIREIADRAVAALKAAMEAGG